VRIERFDPAADDGLLRACYEIYETGLCHDDPGGPPMPLAGFRAWWAATFAGEPRQTWLATDAGRPVGCYLLELPDLENIGVGFALPLVAVAARRRGVGRGLLAHCCEQARRAGRTRLAGGTLRDSAGDAFASAAGAIAGLTDVRQVLPVDGRLPARLASLRARAAPAAAGYDLVRWTGTTPGEYLDQVALVNDAMSDAPREASIDAERWDAARVLAADERSVAQGLHRYSVAARQPATGEIAGLTQLVVDPEVPDWGFQQLTAVTRPHRGRRLGLLVKVAMHEWLGVAEPRLRQVLTFNSETNRRMIAINDQLGYAATALHRNWELSIPDYLTRNAAPG
jgi:GNAT superfamily N-acetyltransferase